MKDRTDDQFAVSRRQRRAAFKAHGTMRRNRADKALVLELCPAAVASRIKKQPDRWMITNGSMALSDQFATETAAWADAVHSLSQVRDRFGD